MPRPEYVSEFLMRDTNIARMYESRRQHPLSKAAYYRRLANHGAVALLLVGGSLLAGMAGYRYLEQMNWLDAFINSASGSKALIDPTKTHPANQWYAVAQTYDGKTYRSYVNGVLEGEADVAFTPHGPGHMMVGVRMNHVNWFKGSVAEARFTDRALAPREFLKVPQ